MQWRRALGMLALACTGFGAIYMLARTQFIKPGNVGVVENYLSGENEILNSGFHCILSPFRSFKAQLPYRYKTIFLENTHAFHTADGIEVNADIVIQYKITDAVEATTRIEEPVRAISQSTNINLANIIRDEAYTFQMLSSAKPLLSSLSNQERKEEKKDDVRVSLFSTLATTLVKLVNGACKNWGILIEEIQIVNIKAKDKQIEQQLESTARQQYEANNLLLSANADQAAKVIQAETEAKRVEKEATGLANALAIKTLAECHRISQMSEKLNIPTETIYQTEAMIQTANALGNTTGSVSLWGGAFPSSVAKAGLLFAHQNPMRRSNSTPSLPAPQNTSQRIGVI